MKAHLVKLIAISVIAISFINIDNGKVSEKKYVYEENIAHNADLSWYLKDDETPQPQSRPTSTTRRTVSRPAPTASAPKRNIPDLDARYSNIKMYGENDYVTSFINQHKNFITTNSNKYRLNAPVIMAMLILENLNVANRKLNTCASVGHNYGNIKVKKSNDRYLSNEFLTHVRNKSILPHVSHMDDEYDRNGRKIHSHFYRWRTPADGMLAYLLFLNSRVYLGHPNYVNNFSGVVHTDHKRWAYAIYMSGYANNSASDIAYDIKIMRIIIQYDLVNKMK